MFESPSLMKRIAIGKLVGFIIGLLGVVYLYLFMPDTSPLIYWGFLFWYATVGAVIGMFGVFTDHPILKLPMPWWVR